jgi:uncharacterized iron-regulated protein
MVQLKAFIKNHTKGEKTTQILTICVEGENGKLYKDYFVNVSKNKGTCYLTECKKEGK